MQILIEVPPRREYLLAMLNQLLRQQTVQLHVGAGVFILLGLLMLFLDSSPYAPAGVVLIVGGPYLWWRAGRLASQVAGKYPRYLREETFTVELTDELVRYEWPGVRTELSWTRIERVADVGDLWLLYCGPSTAIWLPKECFSDDQRVEFAAFLARRQPPAA